jgi:short-subunit dehydrogenase
MTFMRCWPSQVEIITADLSKSSDVASAGAKALELSGGYVHVLVNNAGTGDGMGHPLEGGQQLLTRRL